MPHQTIRILDSHTGGEPTRLVLAGGPELGGGALSERVKIFREKFDGWRSGRPPLPAETGVTRGAIAHLQSRWLWIEKDV